MCVSITPIPDSVRLRVTGDVETVLAVAYDEEERFLVGLSDGTLLMGYYDEAMRCRWEGGARRCRHCPVRRQCRPS